MEHPSAQSWTTSKPGLKALVKIQLLSIDLNDSSSHAELGHDCRRQSHTDTTQHVSLHTDQQTEADYGPYLGQARARGDCPLGYNSMGWGLMDSTQPLVKTQPANDKCCIRTVKYTVYNTVLYVWSL